MSLSLCPSVFVSVSFIFSLSQGYLYFFLNYTFHDQFFLIAIFNEMNPFSTEELQTARVPGGADDRRHGDRHRLAGVQGRKM